MDGSHCVLVDHGVWGGIGRARGILHESFGADGRMSCRCGPGGAVFSMMHVKVGPGLSLPSCKRMRAAPWIVADTVTIRGSLG